MLFAAPPGSGKTALARFLAYLAATVEGCASVQAVCMDGFHFPNAYLDTHTFSEQTSTGTHSYSLRSRKGAPFTFDVLALQAALVDAHSQNPRPWPAYSRVLHDVVSAGEPITGDVLLIEGNYLLLDEPGWRELRHLADDTVFLTASPSLLHERLVARKICGGSSREEAEKWYQSNDGKNVELVLTHRLPANIELELHEDGKISYVR